MTNQDESKPTDLQDEICKICGDCVEEKCGKGRECTKCQAITSLMEREKKKLKEELLYNLDEIDNKPWRVFRQLAKLMPDYEEEYLRYEAFYSYGGGELVKGLIDEWKGDSDDEA